MVDRVVTNSTEWASQAQAEAGVVTNKFMDPLRVKQAIAALAAAGGIAGMALVGGLTIGTGATFAQAGANKTAINAALASAANNMVYLPAGTILVNGPVEIPTGKSLVGMGMFLTELRAIAGFTYSGSNKNGVVVSPNTSGVYLAHMTVNQNKRYLNDVVDTGNRISATQFYISTDVLVERVYAKNATGYGHYSAGSLATPSRNVNWHNCVAENCNVNFEAMGTIGGGFHDCEVRIGDNDIATEVSWHVLNGTSNFRFENCSGQAGSGFGMSIVIPLANPMKDIFVNNCRIYSSATTNALVTDGSGGIDGLFITNSIFESVGAGGSTGYGASLANVTRGRFTNSEFIGNSVGVNTLDNSQIEYNSCRVVAKGGANAVETAAIIAPNTVVTYFNGGSAEAVATGAAAYAFNGAVVHNNTRIVAANHSLRNTVLSPYTLTLLDIGKSLNPLDTGNVTVPPNSSVPFPIGTKIYLGVANYSIDTTFVPGSGVTFIAPNDDYVVTNDKGVVELHQVALNLWTISGAPPAI